MNERDLSGNTILIAEDNDLNYTLFASSLKSTGLIIIRAKNGHEAVEYCRNHPEIKMVLMDGMMPVMNGYEATKEIRMFAPALPIVIITAYVSQFSVQDALSSNCNDYLAKPISQQALITAVKKWVLK